MVRFHIIIEGTDEDEMRTFFEEYKTNINFLITAFLKKSMMLKV